jgi:hypothetical protein
MNYVETLQNYDVIPTVNKNIESIASLTRESEMNQENIGMLRMDLADTKRDQVDLQEEVGEVPNRINEELGTIKIEATSKEVRKIGDQLKFAKNMHSKEQEQSKELEEVASIKEQLAIIKDVCESQDDRMKKVGGVRICVYVYLYACVCICVYLCVCMCYVLCINVCVCVCLQCDMCVFLSSII